MSNAAPLETSRVPVPIPRDSPWLALVAAFRRVSAGSAVTLLSTWQSRAAIFVRITKISWTWQLKRGIGNIQIREMNPLHLPVAISLKLECGCATSQSPFQDIDTDYHGAGEKLAAMVDSRHGPRGVDLE